MRRIRTVLFCAASGLIFGWGLPAYAQDAEPADEPAAEEIVEEAEDEAASEDTIIVTGSRLRRDEFSSPAPIQVITGEVSRDAGLIDTAAILQESSVATGQQVDLTFAGFVLNNGPGASTIDLRGLDPERTLVLINGRRLAPAGVEGAPTVPDLNLVPSALVERFEILLDGASSVYGSDAVAGVVNVLLRKDLEGFEMEWFQSQPEAGNGEETVITATWGANSDKGFIGFGAEYSRRDNVALADRDFSRLCNRHVERDNSGNIRFNDIRTPIDLPGMVTSPCKTNLINRMFIPGTFGSIYNTPGESNSGIPNFSDPGLFFAENSLGTAWDGLALNGAGQRIQDVILDVNGDGIIDPGDIVIPGFGGSVNVDFHDQFWNLNGSDTDRAADLISPREEILFYAYGEYEFEMLGNPTTAFFEASFADRNNLINSGPATIFPDVPADNPFNPCGINATVSCGEAYLESIDEIVLALTGGAFGSEVFEPTTNLGPQGVVPILSVRGDRSTAEVNVQQYRLVGGFKGPLDFLDDFGPLSNWTYEVSGIYSRSTGTSQRRGILDERLNLSLLTTIEDPDNPGQFICGLDVDGDGVPDPEGTLLDPGAGAQATAPPCVPVNLFAPSLYQPGGGTFATEEERDYLFGTRNFTTTIEQSVLQGYITGDIYELPAGTLRGLVGFEYREDTIKSTPDDAAEDGLIIGFFADPGASGRRDLYEVFGELSIPILAGLPFAEELSLEGAVRWTEEENFGAQVTYSGKGIYRPLEWLTLRATYGTSFRAPNLQEQFLKGVTGFLGVEDPCIVPEAARTDDVNTGLEVYNPGGDDRSDVVLANCVAQGVDPEALGLNLTAGQVLSTEILQGGNTALDAESSKSLTAGIVVEKPRMGVSWLDDINLTVGVTYYAIDVLDSIANPTPSFIVSDCLVNNANLASGFCARIDRGPSGFISLIDASFININEDGAEGLDFNFLYEQNLRIGDELLELTVDVDANWQFERLVTIIGDDGVPVSDDNVGEPFFPEFNGLARLIARYRDLRLTWTSRYIGATDIDNDIKDELFDPVTGVSGATCLGIRTEPFNVEGDGSTCRDVSRIDDYFEHDVALAYTKETWTARFGVRNVFDKKPPLVDSSEVLTNGGNVPIGGGFDLFGRTYFINIAKKW